MSPVECYHLLLLIPYVGWQRWPRRRWQSVRLSLEPVYGTFENDILTIFLQSVNILWLHPVTFRDWATCI